MSSSSPRAKKYSYFLVRVKRSDGRITTVSLPSMEMKAASAVLGGINAVRNLAREAALVFKPELAASCSAYALQRVAQAVYAVTHSRLQIQIAPITSKKENSMSKAPAKASVLNLNSKAFQTALKPFELATMQYAGHRVSFQAMPTKVFHSLPECPVQRDTATRAAIVAHLKKASPLHVSVVATSVNGQLHKLDGHSRDSCWNDLDSLEAPPGVFCMVVECQDFEEVGALYDQVDSVPASERPKEKIWGSWKGLGYRTVTPFFASNGPFVSAVRAAFGDIAPATRPRELAQASLACVEKLEAGGKGLGKDARPMVVAAALIVARKMLALGKGSRLVEVVDFLDRVVRADAQPDKKGQLCDAVQLLLTTFEGVARRGGGGSHSDELGYALAALALWMESSEASYPASALSPLTRAQYLGSLEVVRPSGRRTKSKTAEAVVTPEKASFPVTTKSRKVKVSPESAYVKAPAVEPGAKSDIHVVDLALPPSTFKRPVRRPNYTRA